MRYVTLATLLDIDDIMAIISAAQKMMASQGSGQWQDGSPSRETILNDIYQHHFYVAKDEEEIIGVMAILDFDKDYAHLLTGAWTYKEPYMVIHRFAVKGHLRGQGVGSFMLQEAETIAKKVNITTIRIDTHDLNTPMISLLNKNGYRACGTVILEQTKLRTVFEKSI